MPKRSKTERAKSKTETASKLGALGGSIGSTLAPGVGTAIGAGVGAITGLIIGDRELVFPMDMIAIPAFQAYMITGSPGFQIFIKEGEVLNQVQLTDAQEAELTVEQSMDRVNLSQPKKKKKTAYQRRYSKAFNKIKSKHKLKSGKWKKDGFKKAVREAHRMAGGK